MSFTINLDKEGGDGGSLAAMTIFECNELHGCFHLYTGATKRLTVSTQHCPIVFQWQHIT